MRKDEIVVLFLKLLGLYFIIDGLGQFSMVFGINISPVIYVIAGFLLFFQAPKLAKFIINFSKAEEAGQRITEYEKTARIALIVLGIYLFTDAIPNMVQTAIGAKEIYKSSYFYNNPKDLIRLVAFVAGPIISAAIAAVLIIGSDKVIGLLYRYKQRSIQNKEEDEKKLIFNGISYNHLILKISFLVLGIYIFSISIADFLESASLVLYELLHSGENKFNFGALRFISPLATFIGSFIKILISMTLIAGFEKVVVILSKYDLTFKKMMR